MTISLKNKIIYSIGSSFLVIWVALVISVFQLTNGYFIKHKIQDFSSAIGLQAKATSLAFSDSMDVVKTLAAHPDIIEYVKNNRQPQPGAILSILNAYNIQGKYASVMVIDYYGKVLSSTDPVYVNMDLGYREYFKSAINRQETIELFTGYISKRIGYFFTVPIVSDGKVIGVISAKLVPEKINGTVDIGSAGLESTNMMLVDKDGIVVHSSDQSLAYHSLGKLSPAKLDEIKKDQRMQGATEEIKSLGYDQVQDKLNSVKDPEVFTYGVSGGSQRIAGVSRIGDSPFFLFVEEDLSRFNRSSFAVAISTSGIIVIGGLLALTIIYFLISRFLKPISEMRDFSKAIGRGKFDENLEIRTGDEFDDLIQSFNDMADNLDAFYKYLQSQISSKSTAINKKMKELEMKNEALAKARSELHKIKKNNKQ